MNSDIDTLLQAAHYGMQATGIAADLAALVDGLSAGVKQPGSDVARHAVSEGPAAMAVEIKKLVDTATASQPAAVSLPKATSSNSTSQEPSIGETVARTAAMITGVGPLVTGLLRLFGSGDSETIPPLERFSAPAQVSVEAGLTKDREYSAVRYAQGGTPEALAGASRNTAQPPTIQVNIQAMDSRSFLDRQDDIARAVREAMLHSNSLNDVVLEL